MPNIPDLPPEFATWALIAQAPRYAEGLLWASPNHTDSGNHPHAILSYQYGFGKDGPHPWGLHFYGQFNIFQGATWAPPEQLAAAFITFQLTGDTPDECQTC